MKARFTQQQLPVKIVQKDGVDYIFICQNETQGSETYTDIGEGQTEQGYYEYDYNEFSAPTGILDLEDIQAHPENYLEYVYTEQKEDPEDDRVKNLEEQVNSILNAIERGGEFMNLDALESLVRYARGKLMDDMKSTDDKTEGIACRGLIPVYEQNHAYEVGDVRTHPVTGTPKECITAYDGSVQPDWTIDTATLWKPWHSRKKEYALPWEQPTGAHDMYKAGEYMIWTDGVIKKALRDTNFSPEEYPADWEDA